MNKAIRYMHSLEQLSGELRDAADDMADFYDRLKIQQEARAPAEELRLRYQDFLENSTTEDVIDRLNALVKRMKDDEDLEPEVALEPDMINCNMHALRLCTAQLQVSRILAGAG